MPKRLIALLFALNIALQPAVVATAQAPSVPMLAPSAQTAAQESPSVSADYLCPPRLQLRHPELCPELGPASELEELARLGLYPMKPLPTVDISLGPPYLDFVYLRMTREGTPLYPTPENAFAGTGPSGVSPRGFVFYSYYNTYTGPAEEIAYRTGFGYVRDEDVQKATITSRRGMEFSRTPDRPFGWVVSGGICSQITPGSEDYSGNCYVLHQKVQIYGSQQVGEWTWYRIGPDEWLEQRYLSIVFPDTTPPEGVEDDRWIVINLYEQNATAYQDGELVYAAVVSTGLPGVWTRPGLFQVWAKLEADDMTGGEITPDGSNFYFLDNVPWVMYFDGARALHGTYWHSNYGSQASRGCVNMTKADAHWFFEFTSNGTYVYVWDPSGNTPSDPALFGEGGA